MNTCISFPVHNHKTLKKKMLNWVNRFSIFCFLDNSHYDAGQPAFECLLAVGSKSSIEIPAGKGFDELRQFWTAHQNDWLFGHLGYELMNETETPDSRPIDKIGFSDLFYFVPEIVIELHKNELKIYCDNDAEAVYREISASASIITETVKTKVLLQKRIGKTEYVTIIEKLKAHILRGDCYEINFCQEFYAENAELDPLYLYTRLTDLSPNPFSVYYKLGNRYCLCASPERYLKKTGNKLISQPIKGTSRRDPDNRDNDEMARKYLIESSKEKSENIMVVDLVRNDLSRVCKAGTVQVDELFGIYSFPQVHQMISTVSGELENGMNWIDCVKATFPMGSMTGAPKKRVMELIDQYECSGRGLFSGAIGYIKPGGDFDFNVVIRSIMYNETGRYLSFQAGGGITYSSDAEKEYEECLVKAEAMIKVLG